MQNLNLYNYYDKSLADINKEYQETVQASKKITVPSNKKVKIIAVVIIIVVAVCGWLGYYFFIKQSMESIVKAKYIQHKGPDLRSSEEKLGYVKVQIFEFADEPTKKASPIHENNAETPLSTRIKEFSLSNQLKETERPTAYDEKKKIIDSVDKAEAKKAVNVNTNKKSAAVPSPLKFYAIAFEGIDNNQYDTLAKSASSSKLKSTIISSTPSTKTVWRLYKMDDNGNLTINGKSVVLVKNFDDKENAIKFAKDNHIQSVIRMEDIDNSKYDIKFCCTTIEKAKQFAEKSNIRNSTIRIIREK